MTKDHFNTLVFYKNKYNKSQRSLANYLNVSFEKANSCLNYCKERNWLDQNNSLTKAGHDALRPYKVDNAIIMAAGMSSRFAPLSYENPKGLLKVKGEILIERQIRQLKEAGINDIIVVVGYMAERFLYLKEKFNIKIVNNSDYYRYNNPSSLIRVVDNLKNTYVCSSDNYFVENVFEEYVYESYYSAVYIAGKSDEFGMITDKNGRITGINHSPENTYCMLGHVYFSKTFSERFKTLIIKEYEKSSVKERLWEYFLEDNLDSLEIYIRKYDTDKVLEFDSLEDLRNFDDKYIQNTGSTILKNICKVLNCSEADITNIEVMSQGLTNQSFSFIVRDKKYIYRHPGTGTEQYISRKSEAFSTGVAKELGLDTTVIYISEDEGWKISSFFENNHTLDYHNQDEVKKALKLVKRLHDAQIVSDFNFDIWKVTNAILDKLNPDSIDFSDFDELRSSITRLYQLTEKDNEPKVLCHCDCYSPNFLFNSDGDVTLIDWEYSGNDDPGTDVGTFICCSDYTFDEAIKIINLYYGREPTTKELRHKLAYIAITSYYWFIWAIHQESVGVIVGEYKLLWHDNAKLYMEKAFELYEEENN